MNKRSQKEELIGLFFTLSEHNKLFIRPFGHKFAVNIDVLCI